MGRIPDKRILKLKSRVQRGDTTVAADISRLGRSLGMLATVMTEFQNRDVNVITLSGRTMEPNRTMVLFVNVLNDIVAIERDMKAYRSNEILFLRREEGAPIGRPKGSRKSAGKNVLYGKEEQLRQWCHRRSRFRLIRFQAKETEHPKTLVTLSKTPVR